jgi:hypothetical protein
VTQKNQHCASCPPAELTEFESSAIFGPCGNEGAGGRLAVYNDNSNLSHNHGATNVAFDENSPNNKVRFISGLYSGFSNCGVANNLVKVVLP